MSERKSFINTFPNSPITPDTFDKLAEHQDIESATPLVTKQHGEGTGVHQAAIRVNDTGHILAYYPDDHGWRQQVHISCDDDESTNQFEQRLIFRSQVACEEYQEERPELGGMGSFR